ncbi:MAG TPA: DUF2059 domain-containing protein [Paludibacter sp.]|nr:DUF2059 domain-containing protein [Paludibacter sp.]
MKKLIFTSALCLSVFCNSYSQTKQESIKQLFHLMQTDSLLDKMFSSMIPQILNQQQMQITDSVSRAAFDTKMGSVMLIAKDISKKLLNEDMVVLYDKYFNQAEINDFVNFYKTPSGQKMISMTPDIQKDLMNVMMQKYMPEMQKSIMAQFENKK